MTAALTQQLVAWLAETNIGALELRGPGVHLCLHQALGSVEAVSPVCFAVLVEAAHAADAQAAGVAIKAGAVGIFVHAHPLHDAPLAAPGTAVVAGQVIGLLRVGAMLLPVAAPQAGIIAGYIAADGALVGYGSHLADLIPSLPAADAARTATHHGH